MYFCAFWRRLDVPGHDACRLHRQPDGDWRIDGTAVFDEGQPTVAAYSVTCDSHWVTRRASVRGWQGRLDIVAEIERAGEADGAWMLNGAPVPGLEDCLDVDLGFTPATNLVPIRRLALGIGEGASAPAAIFDVSNMRLERIEQSYKRTGETGYWYESPKFDYAATLEISSDGFVVSYPGLWEAESDHRMQGES